MKPARAQRGFGMLEAVVALVLFALAGSTLFAWINTNLDAAARLRQRDRSQALVQLASAWLQTRNPMSEASGETEIAPGTRLRWQARALTPVTPGAPLPAAPGRRFGSHSTRSTRRSRRPMAAKRASRSSAWASSATR